MKAPLHLEIPAQSVTIGEEKFTLTEMAAARAVEYAGIFDKMLEEEKADPAPEGLSTDDPAFQEWFGRSVSRGNAPIRFLLGKDDAWIESNMVRTMKDQLLAAQRALNNPGGTQGNAPSPGDATT